jgi:hypothetical protein
MPPVDIALFDLIVPPVWARSAWTLPIFGKQAARTGRRRQFLGTATLCRDVANLDKKPAIVNTGMKLFLTWFTISLVREGGAGVTGALSATCRRRIS